MLEVATAAENANLTSLATVKLELGITSTTDDAWLEQQIESQSLAAINYMGVVMADDGTRNIARESLVETIDRRSRYGQIQPFAVIAPHREADIYLTLARRPVVSITSVTEDGNTLDPSGYQLDAASGRLKRLSVSLPATWPSALIVVTYVAGWLMPDDQDRNLPTDIEDAVIAMVKAAWFSRKRDPSVKSEDIPGVRRVDYFFGTPGQSPLPSDATVRLDVYRNIHL